MLSSNIFNIVLGYHSCVLVIRTIAMFCVSFVGFNAISVLVSFICIQTFILHLICKFKPFFFD